MIVYLSDPSISRPLNASIERNDTVGLILKWTAPPNNERADTAVIDCGNTDQTPKTVS